MKLIIAIIQPEELPEIKEELLKNKIHKFTVSAARGQGKELPFTEVYRGISHEITLLKKIRLETEKWENTNQESMYKSLDDIYNEAYRKVMNV